MFYRGFGGRDRVRTCDLVVANDALSQLSYTPTADNLSILAEASEVSNKTRFRVTKTKKGRYESALFHKNNRELQGIRVG
jgi:hypothetical protein